MAPRVRLRGAWIIFGICSWNFVTCPISGNQSSCLILSNFTISQTNYVSVHLVNTCNTSINYPGVNASSDHSGVSGLYDTWWYVLGGGNGSGNQSGHYPYYQMGWQLSFNQSIAGISNFFAFSEKSSSTSAFIDM